MFNVLIYSSVRHYVLVLPLILCQTKGITTIMTILLFINDLEICQNVLASKIKLLMLLNIIL